MSDKLRLKATDAEDLGVISAVLQDARISLSEMAFIKDEQRFLAAFTRYRRERQPDPHLCEGLTEIMSVLSFQDIQEVKYRGLDPEKPTASLSLLTIATEPNKNFAVDIKLIFEGEGEISLRSARIAAVLDDFGDAKPCAVTPCDHEASILPGWTESYDAQA